MMRDRASIILIAIGIVLLGAVFVFHFAFAQTVTGNMDISVRVIIIPTAPTSLVATTTSATRVDLSWADTSSNETGFKIESKIGVGGTYSEIDSVGTNVTAYAATALSPSTTYYFRVRAFNNDGTSAYTNEASSTTDAAPYVPPPPSNPGSSSGGPSYTPPSYAQAISVAISGYAHPNRKISVLIDGVLKSATLTGADAAFSVSVDTTEGVLSLGIYSSDAKGRRSLTFTFTLSLNAGTVASVSGIFLAPIIEVDKSEVKKGDTLTITGETVPSSTVSIVVNSITEITKEVVSDIFGKYLYVLDTGALELGDHTVHSNAILSDSLASVDSSLIAFKVGTKTVGKYMMGDINKGGRVNMTDFSILLYNWGKTTKSALDTSDLNKDGKVNIVDLSILFYYWTG